MGVRLLHSSTITEVHTIGEHVYDSRMGVRDEGSVYDNGLSYEKCMEPYDQGISSIRFMDGSQSYEHAFFLTLFFIK